MHTRMQIRMNDEELTYWKQAAAALMLAGLTPNATIAELIRYGLSLVRRTHPEVFAELKAAREKTHG